MKRDDFPPASIIVGIDGSKAAVRAAVWAIAEAVSRDIPLRLVHVIEHHDGANLHSDTLDQEYARGEHVTHQAWRTVEATGEPVKLEMEILRGDPVVMLAQASRSAAMICLGWTGHDLASRSDLGATATALSRSAHCPVAVIRLHARASLDGRWIIARVDETLSSKAVLHHAVEEARLRKAPLLALVTGRDHDHADADTASAVGVRLDRHLAEHFARPRDVPVCSLPIGHGVLEYLAKSANLAQLVVVGADDPRVVPELTGPHADMVLHHTNCSVMSVRTHLAEEA